MAFKYPIEGTVILGAAQCQHLIAVALVPPCPRALEPHMTNAFVRRFNPTTAKGIAPSPFNIVIARRAARTSTHDRRFRIRCLEAVLLCDHIEIGRGNVSTHVERAEDSPLDATSHRGSDPDGAGDTPSNCQSLSALLQRRAACASTHPGPIRLSQGRAASRWL